jgi:hypothetical protein
MAFELLKLFMPKTYWNASLNKDKSTGLVILETLYFVYLIALLFVGYWYIGVAVLIASVITAYQLMDDVMTKTEFNKQIGRYLFADGVVSILFLVIIVIKELNLVTI